MCVCVCVREREREREKLDTQSAGVCEQGPEWRLIGTQFGRVSNTTREVARYIIMDQGKEKPVEKGTGENGAGTSGNPEPMAVDNVPPAAAASTVDYTAAATGGPVGASPAAAPNNPGTASGGAANPPQVAAGGVQPPSNSQHQNQPPTGVVQPAADGTQTGSQAAVAQIPHPPAGQPAPQNSCISTAVRQKLESASTRKAQLHCLSV